MFLHFGDLYSKAHSKHLSFDSLAPNDDAVVLEGLRELTLRRGRAVGRECQRLAAPDLATHAEW
jgi:hypothetical protein